NAIDVDDRTAVDAHEAGWIENRGDTLHGLTQQWTRVVLVQAHVVPARLDPFHVFHAHDIGSASRANTDPVHIRCGSRGLLECCLDTGFRGVASLEREL